MSDIFSPRTFRLHAEQAGGAWDLVSDVIDDEDRMNILCVALSDMLPRLGFEAQGEIDAKGNATLKVNVIAPQRRHWSGTTLKTQDILDASAAFEVRSAAGRTRMTWKQRGVTGSATVGEESEPVRIADGVAVCPSSVPSVSLETRAATWRQATGELEIEAFVTFKHCPPFPEGQRAVVVFVQTGETFDGSYDPATARFKTTIVLRHARPRTVEMRVAWKAEWSDTPLLSLLSADVPIHFGRPEFKSTDRDFAAHIYLGLEPVYVRFEQHEYLPDELVANFSFRKQVSQCRLTHREDTREPALYDVVEWIGDALDDFRRAAPGMIRMTLEGESDAQRQVMLLPGIIDGTWTLAKQKPVFRLSSSTLDEGLIEKASDSISADLLDAKASRGVVTLNAGTSLITHLVLADGSPVPVNPGKFTPLFLRDPLCIWKQQKQRPRTRFAGNLSTELAPAAQLRGSESTPIKDSVTNGTIAVSSVQRAAPGPAILDFGGRHQMLVYRHDTLKSPGGVIRGDRVPADKPLGLYFRGFYFAVEVIDVDGEFAPGSKLLLLKKPMRLDFSALTNHVMPFSPLRASYSNEQSTVVVVVEGQRVITLPLDESGVIRDVPRAAFQRLGYLYRDRDSTPLWTPAAAPAEPWLYTFDNVAFSIGEEHVSFAGWLLPGGAATFGAQPPFTAYAFDFTGNPATAVAVLKPFPLGVRNWITPLPGVTEEELQKFNEAIDEKLRELHAGTSDLQQINDAEFLIPIAGKREYQAICEWSPSTNELRLLVGPPLRTPAVQFFTLI